jgi:hypothetical protein
MIATVMSSAEGLLVVREQRAATPELAKQGRFAHQNVMLVAQLDGESHEAFSTRVLARVSRETNQRRPLRAVIVSLEAEPSAETAQSRQRLVRSLAEALASGPGCELVLQASASTGAETRCRLFELVEATTRAVPMLSVRLAFENPAKYSVQKRPGSRELWRRATAAAPAVWS